MGEAGAVEVMELKSRLESSRKVLEVRLRSLAPTQSLLKEQKEVLRSSALTVREAALAFEETLNRLEQYDARLAEVEAQRARRRRWKTQTDFLRLLEEREEREKAAPPPTTRRRSSEDAPPAPSDAEVRDNRNAEIAAAAEALEAAEKALSKHGGRRREGKGNNKSEEEESSEWSFMNLVFGGDNTSNRKKGLDDAREEAAGWLHDTTKASKGPRRRWFVLKHHADLGPFLEYAVAPGSPALGRILLAGCEVVALEEEEEEGGDVGRRTADEHQRERRQQRTQPFFSFCVAHQHQRRRDLACVNVQTRKQWVSVLGQLIRDHAKAQRAQETALLAAKNGPNSASSSKDKNYPPMTRTTPVLPTRASAEPPTDDDDDDKKDHNTQEKNTPAAVKTQNTRNDPDPLALAKLKHYKAKQRLALLQARADADLSPR
eukprot:CAMPEP_0118898270 /NCGR_PEP_ID=MMETSP1166-20130328/5330_1 /TAXON_ID=1104430 /ORGANISM="Chrysoreinhardia sp, Strain CCMP3193" /LENGTH=431 /DNA_ID=CAMNT_0006837365 /DNA_START=90 /DNA_END=1385 /DNA_ORIENTATION=+